MSNDTENSRWECLKSWFQSFLPSTALVIRQPKIYPAQSELAARCAPYEKGIYCTTSEFDAFIFPIGSSDTSISIYRGGENDPDLFSDSYHKANCEELSFSGKDTLRCYGEKTTGIFRPYPKEMQRSPIEIVLTGMGLLSIGVYLGIEFIDFFSSSKKEEEDSPFVRFVSLEQSTKRLKAALTKLKKDFENKVKPPFPEQLGFILFAIEDFEEEIDELLQQHASQGVRKKTLNSLIDSVNYFIKESKTEITHFNQRKMNREPTFTPQFSQRSVSDMENFMAASVMRSIDAAPLGGRLR